jgi:hypothetical protein
MRFKWTQFGRDVRSTRERMGFGLRDCCRAMPINKSTWCRAESGQPIQVPHFVFLCEWMNRDPSIYAVSAPRPH